MFRYTGDIEKDTNLYKEKYSGLEISISKCFSEHLVAICLVSFCSGLIFYDLQWYKLSIIFIAFALFLFLLYGMDKISE